MSGSATLSLSIMDDVKSTRVHVVVTCCRAESILVGSGPNNFATALHMEFYTLINK